MTAMAHCFLLFQTQRAEEGEKYEKEIECLKARLQKLTADNKEREDRQRKSCELEQACQDELMHTKELLNIAHEEIQSKTAQVKQYRKQNDQISAQVLVYILYY